MTLRLGLEALRDTWFEAPSLADRKALARKVMAMGELPFIPMGAYRLQTAVRRASKGGCAD